MLRLQGVPQVVPRMRRNPATNMDKFKHEINYYVAVFVRIEYICFLYDIIDGFIFYILTCSLYMYVF